MSYFPDLSLYRYVSTPYGPTFSIGWLEAGYDYPKGQVPIPFLRKLNHYLSDSRKYGIYFTRGFFESTLPPVEANFEEIYIREIPELKAFYGSSSELHVKHKEKYYAAPQYIITYIVKHAYLPPQQFIDAVLEGEVINDRMRMEMEEELEALLEKARPKSGSEAMEMKKYLFEVQNLVVAEDIVGAKALLKEALSKHPYSPFLRFFKAHITSKYEGDSLQGLEELEACLKLNPNQPIFLAEKACMYFRLDRDDEALELFELLLPNFEESKTNNRSEILLYMGMIYERKSNLEKALACLEKAHQLAPGKQEIQAVLQKYEGEK